MNKPNKYSGQFSVDTSLKWTLFQGPDKKFKKTTFLANSAKIAVVKIIGRAFNW